MKYRQLGSKGPVVSTVGFGAWGISGRDWGNSDDENSREAIHTALDAGVNFIDTADVYGFGHSEELIRQVLDDRTDKDRIIIASKAGNNFYPFIGQEPEVLHCPSGLPCCHSRWKKSKAGKGEYHNF